MTWLAHGVPLALIADLADPDGPLSRQIYAAEAVADDVRRDAATPAWPGSATGGSSSSGDDFSAAAAG